MRNYFVYAPCQKALVQCGQKVYCKRLAPFHLADCIHQLDRQTEELRPLSHGTEDKFNRLLYTVSRGIRMHKRTFNFFAVKPIIGTGRASLSDSHLTVHTSAMAVPLENTSSRNSVR